MESVRLVPKSMTLNDLRTKFKVIDSINAAKMAKYSLVMTPTPFVEWLDALCLLGLLIPWCTYILTYTYLHSWLGAYNTGNISETVEDKAKVTIITAYIKSYTGFQSPPKCMTLNDLWARFTDGIRIEIEIFFRMKVTLVGAPMRANYS